MCGKRMSIWRNTYVAERGVSVGDGVRDDVADGMKMFVGGV